MKFSFNLIDQAWIPVIIADGDFLELSLRETLARTAFGARASHHNRPSAPCASQTCFRTRSSYQPAPAPRAGGASRRRTGAIRY